MEKEVDYKNKTIKCAWCNNYDNETSICNKRKIRLKARSKRKCEYFIPDNEKIDKEINKGTNIKKYKRPDWYFLRGSKRKKAIIKEETQRILNETMKDEAHPFTGTLGNIHSTAVTD